MNYNFRVTRDMLPFGLALIAGLGLILMIVALATGVNVSEATGNLLLFLFLGGLVLLIFGVAGWVIAVQPYKHFDDINEPAPDEHGHGHEHDSDETAIVPHDAGALTAETADAHGAGH